MSLPAIAISSFLPMVFKRDFNAELLAAARLSLQICLSICRKAGAFVFHGHESRPMALFRGYTRLQVKNMSKDHETSSCLMSMRYGYKFGNDVFYHALPTRVQPFAPLAIRGAPAAADGFPLECSAWNYRLSGADRLCPGCEASPCRGIRSPARACAPAPRRDARTPARNRREPPRPRHGAASRREAPTSAWGPSCPSPA